MQENLRSPQSSTTASVWVKRFLPLIKPGDLVLDLAAGSGRHVRLLRDCGFAVCAVDRDTTALSAFAGPDCEVRKIDLETDDRCRSAMTTKGSSLPITCTDRYSLPLRRPSRQVAY